MKFQMIIAAVLGTTSAFIGCSNPTTKFEPIVQQVIDGSLKPNRDGVITVPKEFDEITTNNEAYFEQKSDGRVLILFPTWRGRGDDLEGYLYCSGELLETDYYAIDWGEGGAQRHFTVAGRDMLTVEPLTPNWYKVVRRLD
jgi:hypothetical protein